MTVFRRLIVSCRPGVLLLATSVAACEAPTDVEFGDLVGTWEATELVFHDVGQGQRVDRVKYGAGLTMTIASGGGTTWLLRPGNGFFSILTGNLEVLGRQSFFLRFDPAADPATGIIALEHGRLLMQFDTETTVSGGSPVTLQLLFAFRRA